MAVNRYIIFISLITSTVCFRIGPIEDKFVTDDGLRVPDESRLPELLRLLESLQKLLRLSSTVRVTSQQTRTDIIENSLGSIKRGMNGVSSILPPWSEFCRMVKMRNCFTPGGGNR